MAVRSRRARIDVVVSHLNEPVVLLRNEADRGPHWLGLELVGRRHRDVVGARVVVEAGGRRLTRFATGGGSYLSAGDRRLLFGLGPADRVESVTVFWPGGPEQRWAGTVLKTDRYWRLILQQHFELDLFVPFPPGFVV